jgi:large subunit ribosomal protein L4
MVGGGWAFAKRNRDYSYSLGKKKMRAALCSALSMVAGEGKMKVVDNFDLDSIKTKVAASTLNTLKVDRALVVDCKAGEEQYTTLNNENLRLSVRNLQNYKYLRPEGVNVYDILHYGGVVVTRKGLERLEARLKG